VKRLIVSVKTPSEALDDFVRVCKSVQERKVRGVHRELAFDNRKAFERFVSNLVILSQIAALKPKSVYELAKATGRDISNLNKVVVFLEEVGVIRVKKSIANGRPIKTPIVDYDRIEFRLRADSQ
jgi:predicted transcriptional regulator